MTYEQTLDYLFARLPMYQRIGATAFKKDLTNIVTLCEALGNPQNSFESIHIAGTNGKGSTSHILSAVYQNNGYNVGLYTSPHLVDFRERIKINGEICSKEFVIGFTKEIKPLIEEIKPSFFEITVAMAFTYFAIQKVDVAIIETGLGGRLDSTNILLPLASIITSIGYDHKDMLGNTLELIAAEKAGIIKSETPLVLGNIDAVPKQVIQKIAADLEAPIHNYYEGTFRSDLRGKHQQWNIGTALKCLEILHNEFPVEMDLVNYALQNVCTISNFEGRWQTLADNPLVICDVAHNEEGIQLIAEQLIATKKDIYYILGFVKDKELNKIIPLFPSGKTITLVKPNVIRGMESEAGVMAFKDLGHHAESAPSLSIALKQTYDLINKTQHPKNALLFIGGSNFLVADLLLLKSQNQLPWIS
ncbi:Mur ligase family protein [Bacteroidia bacterium]|nr:Mur ligase family protein [Bacteroidia bacterium]MDC1395216.1 Mur ligase family protein [Bacteroidia bacterium]